MTWLALVLLAAAALAPLGLALLRPPRRPPPGRREADLALYRAQLAELDRERAAGRLDPAAHRAAVIEVQRRLLAAPAETAGAAPARRLPPALALGLVPLVAALGAGLYLWHGAPGLPSAPYAERAAAAAREEALLAELRARLAALDPASETARQGYVLLGNAERTRGRPAAAAEAWTRALAARFDPGLAGDLAEVELERGETDAALRWLARALAEAPREPRLRFLAGLAEARAGRVESARAAWRALLADAPPDAPWRALVERRLAELP
ncbi:c-type cytochrome biogenesis protein CcmI [Caldovatus aquaticus]|uniref:c-type cytochrome biogenesis protein CcmI n=1 Tax=Caldovatus aquaticus TaxID=2865671 RepID=UPI0034E2143E